MTENEKRLLEGSIKYISSIVLVGAIIIGFYGYTSLHAYLKELSISSSMVEFDYNYYYVNSLYSVITLILMMGANLLKYLIGTKHKNKYVAALKRIGILIIIYSIPILFWLFFIRDFINWKSYWVIICVCLLLVFAIIDYFLVKRNSSHGLGKTLLSFLMYFFIVAILARAHGNARGNEVWEAGDDIYRISFNLKEDNNEINENKEYLFISYNKGRYFFIEKSGEGNQCRKVYVLDESEILNVKVIARGNNNNNQQCQQHKTNLQGKN